MPTTGEQLATYLREVQAAFSTSVARIRAIRIAHALNRAPFPIPLGAAPSAVRLGGAWAPVAQAITAMPVTRYPAGLAGRRDAFILLILDRLQLDRP